MTKKIITILAILIVGGAIFWVTKNISSTPVPIEKTPNKVEKIKIAPVIIGSDQTLPLSNDPKDVAWAFFQKYLEFNKNKNLEGVRSTVYKISAVCEDPKTRIDCEARMGAAYKYGSALKKEDFVHIWEDENQIILSSDFKINEDDSIIGRNRAIIFFLKTETGLKLLSFSPFKGSTISKGEASEQELSDRLIIYTQDNDNDGLADYDEECLGAKEGEVCNKTNPKIRDTDGDGFWDGVQVLMR